MQIIKCDKCGEIANKAYYNAGICKTVHNTPYVITLQEGTYDEGEPFIIERKTIRWELCRKCFEELRQLNMVTFSS